MKLEQGKEYTLKYTGQFCHAATPSVKTGDIRNEFPMEATFLGCIYTVSGERNIFCVADPTTYLMFDIGNIDYIVQKPTQLELQKRVVSESGVNIVTCGHCGDVLLHETKDEEIECPHCNFKSEPCDFPDLQL